VRLARHATLGVAILLSLGGCGSQVGSVGAVLGRDNDTHALFVRDVPSGMAANKAGLIPGDEIVMIDGFYVRELGMKEIRALLRGDIGSKVDLTIVRGEKVQHVKVTRGAFREGTGVKPKEEKLEE
jgi:C-terminal processing protease CtpA/Prc